MQAWAAVGVEPGRVEFRRVAAPEPGPEDVVLRIGQSWISNGTEGSFVRGERIAGDTPWRPGDPHPFPLVPGYQKVGTVEWVGPAVADLEVGETVFATVSRVEGMYFPTGGHVSPAVTHRSQVWKLPPGVEPAAFSGMVLTQVGYNVAQRLAVAPADAAVVLGDGLIGHWAGQVLQERGARVLLVGRHDQRLGLFAAGHGDRVVNARTEDVAAVVREWAPDGVQAVAHTAGPVAPVEALFPMMRRNGQISSAAFCGTEGQFDIQKLRARELSLHAPAGWAQDRMDATRERIADGRLRTLPLVTHHFPAAEAAAAFELVLHRTEPVLGVVLDWD